MRPELTGLLATAGENPFADHRRACAFFTKCRGQRESLCDDSECFCVSAFSGQGFEEKACASPRTWDILVLGTPIYRGCHGKEAMSVLRGDFEHKPLACMAEDFDGQFCMFVRDPAGKGFRVMTDHAGIIQMYLYKSGKTIAVSSSSMALSRSFPVTVNLRAVAQFLRGASVYGSETIYNEITVLEPASLYTFEAAPGGVSVSNEGYWKPPAEIEEGMSFREARDKLMRTMLESFRALPGEGVICDLTAGYDSRLILSLLSMHRPLKDMEIFVFGPPGSREVGLVGSYCARLGITGNHLALPDDWYERVPDYVRRSLHITDGEENIFVYAPILYAQEHKARSHAFSVNGLGGELYRDFWWIQELYPSKRPAGLDRLIDTRVLQYEFDYSVLSEGWSRGMPGMRGIIRHEFQASIRDMDPGSTYNTLQIDNLYLRQKMRRWAGRAISSSTQVIGMLTPLVMKRCIAAAMSTPPSYKRNGRLVKGIIEELSPELSWLKMLNGAPCRNMTLRNAHRFVPLAADYGKRGARKLVQKLLKRTVLLDRSISYPQAAFFAAMFSEPGFRDDFRYDRLLTAKLYHPASYSRFYEAAVEGRSVCTHQLGNIITLEMRMRGDNIRRETGLC